jgi:hypothetical protein
MKSNRKENKTKKLADAVLSIAAGFRSVFGQEKEPNAGRMNERRGLKR